MGFGVITSLPRVEKGYVPYEHLEQLAKRMELSNDWRDRLIARQREQLEAWVEFASTVVGKKGSKTINAAKAALIRETRKVLG